MPIFEIVLIICVILISLLSVIFLCKQSDNRSVYNTNVKGNKNRVNNSNSRSNNKTNVNSGNSFSLTNSGKIIKDNNINGDIIFDGSKKDITIKFETPKGKGESDESGIWLFIIVGVICLGFAISQYVTHKDLIIKILLSIEVVGFVSASVWSIITCKKSQNLSLKLIDRNSLILQPIFFLGSFISTLFLKYSIYTPKLISEFNSKFYFKDAMSFIFNPKYKHEFIFLSFQVFAVLCIVVFIIILFATFLRNISIAKIHTCDEPSFLYKFWSKIYSVKLISLNRKSLTIFSM